MAQCALRIQKPVVLPDSTHLGGVTGGPFRFSKTGFCSEIRRAHVSGPILFEYQKTFGVLKQTLCRIRIRNAL